jgi:hypothetical protein
LVGTSINDVTFIDSSSNTIRYDGTSSRISSTAFFPVEKRFQGGGVNSGSDFILPGGNIDNSSTLKYNGYYCVKFVGFQPEMKEL